MLPNVCLSLERSAENHQLWEPPKTTTPRAHAGLAPTREKPVAAGNPGGAPNAQEVLEQAELAGKIAALKAKFAAASPEDEPATDAISKLGAAAAKHERAKKRTTPGWNFSLEIFGASWGPCGSSCGPRGLIF